jgi:hypothetical protein
MEVMKVHEARVRLACPRRTRDEQVQSGRVGFGVTVASTGQETIK